MEEETHLPSIDLLGFAAGKKESRARKEWRLIWVPGTGFNSAQIRQLISRYVYKCKPVVNASQVKTAVAKFANLWHHRI